MSQRLNLHIQSEKRQVKAQIKLVLKALNLFCALKRFHNSHTVKHYINTSFNHPKLWVKTKRNSHKNLIRKEKRKTLWQGHHENMIPSNIFIIYYLSTLQLVIHPRPKAYINSAK